MTLPDSSSPSIRRILFLQTDERLGIATVRALLLPCRVPPCEIAASNLDTLTTSSQALRDQNVCVAASL